MAVLSIVVPAYNEEAFIGALLESILGVDTESLGFAKEIIVVNDGSKDGTEAVVRRFPQIQLINQVPNQGRGAAMKRGIVAATGDYILFQDADLEYNPKDYARLLPLLKAGPMALYGNRLAGVIEEHGRGLLLGKHPRQSISAWGGALLVRAFTSLLVGEWVPDMYSGIKLYPAKALKEARLETNGFELDHEITVKLYRAGVKFGGAPISYLPRSVEQGKKIRAKDGLIAFWTVLKYRLKPYAQCIQPRPKTLPETN